MDYLTEELDPGVCVSRIQGKFWGDISGERNLFERNTILKVMMRSVNLRKLYGLDQTDPNTLNLDSLEEENISKKHIPINKTNSGPRRDAIPSWKGIGEKRQEEWRGKMGN